MHSMDIRPIFLVGCGHSGTSLLARLIGAHSRIYAIPGETNIAINRNAPVLQDGMRRFQELALANGCERWVEKTPRQINCIDFLVECSMNCQIIAILRDPRDVVFSLKKRNGDLGRSIKRWAQDNTALLPFLSHPQCHILRYEDLIENPVDEMTKAMSFLGEVFEESQLSFHEKKVQWYAKTDEKPLSDIGEANHNQNRNWQINQPLFDGRGKWKTGLTSVELEEIKTSLAALASRINYKLE